MSVEERLRAYAKEQGKGTLDEEKLQAAIRTSKEAFWRSETERETTWLEFLYQQATYIRKRWWAAQGGVLLVMWLALYLSDSSRQVQRYMGIMTPLFVILILPELWKNRSSGSMEVEGAAFFPIQKIYAARLLLFAMADLLLVSVFLVSRTCRHGYPDPVCPAAECDLLYLFSDIVQQKGSEYFFCTGGLFFLDHRMDAPGVQRPDL